jgi:hypothetical protein
MLDLMDFLGTIGVDVAPIFGNEFPPKDSSKTFGTDLHSKSETLPARWTKSIFLVGTMKNFGRRKLRTAFCK